MGRLALRRMWTSIVDSGEDQCVRFQLLTIWLHLFHQDGNAECVPPAHAADAAPALAEDSMVPAQALDAGIIDADNTLDAFRKPKRTSLASYRGIFLAKQPDRGFRR